MSSGRLPATRAAALARLSAFLPSAGRDYAAGRNFDCGGFPGADAGAEPSAGTSTAASAETGQQASVSQLSPYIRHRLLLEPEVVAAVLAGHPPSACHRFVQEVYWRSYWKGWLENRPAIWTRYQSELAALVLQLAHDTELDRRFCAATDGTTGIDCFDHWARELVGTGYLHNHARMWVASIWIFTLRLPWQLGADWFLRHLLDGDPASNTLSWRWVAGLHTRGKHYLARAANIAEYTRGRFDPQGELDESARALPPDSPVAIERLRVPVVADPGRAGGLLITDEDALPETLGIEPRISTALSIACTPERSPLPGGELAHRFAADALADAGMRAAAAFDCAAQSAAIDGVDRGSMMRVDAIVRWAREHELQQVLTAFACVGPVRTLFDELRPALAAHSIELIEVRRGWDGACWPHATRGYFDFSKATGALAGQSRALISSA